MIRPAQAADESAVLAVIDAAFAPSTYEAELVQRLLRNQREIRHWVSVSDAGGISGHILYTRAYHGETPIGWHLAPLAVLPEWQRQGVGSELLRETLDASELGGEPVFVLGAPAYYGRFGFELVPNPVCAFDEGNAHFMAQRWNGAGGPAFTVGYEPEFYI